MKRLLAVGILSLAALGMATAPAPALFHCCHWGCCGKCCQTICIRPYNAFTPVCFGSLCCTGCSPLATCYPPPALSGPPAYGPGFCGDSGCYGADGSMSMLPPGAVPSGTVSGDATVTGTPTITPPQTTPVSGMPTTQVWPNPMQPGMVMPTGYPPMMYPRPNAGYGPMQMPNDGFAVGMPMNSQPTSFGTINAFSGN
jgi:hypothetical protein